MRAVQEGHLPVGLISGEAGSTLLKWANMGVSHSSSYTALSVELLLRLPFPSQIRTQRLKGIVTVCLSLTANDFLSVVSAHFLYVTCNPTSVLPKNATPLVQESFLKSSGLGIWLFWFYWGWYIFISFQINIATPTLMNNKNLNVSKHITEVLLDKTHISTILTFCIPPFFFFLDWSKQRATYFAGRDFS